MTLTRGQVATINVQFAPTGSGFTSQTITVSSDDPNPRHTPRNVIVSGIGK